MYYDLPDYDRVIHSIFTPEAIEAYEASDVVRIQKTDDGRVWRLAPGKRAIPMPWRCRGCRPCRWNRTAW